MNQALSEDSPGSQVPVLELFLPQGFRGRGVGITRIDGGYGVKVNVEAAPAADAKLPEAIDGVPVRIEVVGKLRKG